MSATAPEAKLTRDARGGDQRALAKIFSDYHQPLYRYCLAILRDRQDAEDALQETMIKVLRSLPGEEREIALRPWLYRIAHNESVELLRRRRQSVPLAGSEPAAGGELPERVEMRERLRQLISDLTVLPERQRGALLMREAAGLDFDEIGAALDTSAAAARQTLYEARLGLREIDAGREMECAAVTRALSDGDRRVRRRRDIRAHLRHCAGCRAFAEEIDSRRTDLAAIAPLPAVAAAALLHGILAGGAGAGAAAAGGAGAAGGIAAGASGASGLGTLAAGGAAKSIGSAALLKAVAAVVVVAAIGVGAADRGGLIHLGDQDRAPAPRTGPPPRQANEGAPSSAGAEDSSAGGSKAGHRSASRTQAERAGARGSLGPARKAQLRPRGRSAVENAGPAPVDPGNTVSVEEPAAEAPGNSAVEHPSGRGHDKQTPANGAHGQETAAANHTANQAKETPPGKGAAEHPVHPPHPSHPATPVTEAEPPNVAESPPAAATEHAANPVGNSK